MIGGDGLQGTDCQQTHAFICVQSELNLSVGFPAFRWLRFWLSMISLFGCILNAFLVGSILFPLVSATVFRSHARQNDADGPASSLSPEHMKFSLVGLSPLPNEQDLGCGEKVGQRKFISSQPTDTSGSFAVTPCMYVEIETNLVCP